LVVIGLQYSIITQYWGCWAINFLITIIVRLIILITR